MKKQKLTFEDELLLRDLIRGVRKSSLKDLEHENRYYNFKEKIICTLCYERSLFEGKTRVILAKYQRFDKPKDTGEEECLFVCGDCSDGLDMERPEREFIDMFELSHDDESGGDYDTA